MPEYKFIPHSESRVSKYKESYESKITVFSFILFFIILGGYGATYFYKWYLNNQITAFKSTFEKMKSELEIQSVSEIINKSKEIDMAANVLKNHEAVSKVFESIEKNTIKNNFYSSFSLKYEGSNSGSVGVKTGLSITLVGTAKSYSDLAKQIIVLRNAEDYEKVDFSNFSLVENGDINYNLSLLVKSAVLKF